MEISFIVLYVMMPFLDPTPRAIGPQKRHLKCLSWLEVELTSKKDELLGTKRPKVWRSNFKPSKIIIVLPMLPIIDLHLWLWNL